MFVQQTLLVANDKQINNPEGFDKSVDICFYSWYGHSDNDVYWIGDGALSIARTVDRWWSIRKEDGDK